MSDPTSRPRTLTPGSVRGSLTSRLLVIGTTWMCCPKAAPKAQVICAAQLQTILPGDSVDIIGQNRCPRSLPFQRGEIGSSRSRRTPNCAWNSAADVRAMLERATAFEPSVVEGRFMIRVARDSRPWIVIVEPDNDASLLVVVTAYEVSE